MNCGCRIEKVGQSQTKLEKENWSVLGRNRAVYGAQEMLGYLAASLDWLRVLLASELLCWGAGGAGAAPPGGPEVSDTPLVEPEEVWLSPGAREVGGRVDLGRWWGCQGGGGSQVWGEI